MSVLFDFWIFIIQLLASILRKPKQVQWLLALSTPFKSMLIDLQLFIDTTLEDSKYSAQTHVFTYYLQSKFSGLNPSIENSNNATTPETELGTRLLNDYDVFAGTRNNNSYNVIVGTRLGGESPQTPDFYVKVIATPTADELISLRSHVNRYKIYATTYQITNIDKNIIYYQNY